MDGNEQQPHLQGSNGSAPRVESTALVNWDPNFQQRQQQPYSFPPRPQPVSAASTKPIMDVNSLLSALRRRWFLAFSLGITFAACAGAAAWWLVEAPYQAYSELRVNVNESQILYQENRFHSRDSFKTYKETAMRMVLSPFVLNAAIRKPEIASLSLLQEEEHPVRWLEENVRVTSPAMEFIRISLDSDRPREAKTLVNSITDAYLEEVVNSERNDKLKRKTQLEKVGREIEDKLLAKRNTLRKLAESMQGSDPTALTAKQKMAVEYFAQLRKEHASVRFQLMRIKAQLAAKENPVNTATADDAESGNGRAVETGQANASSQVDIPDIVVEANLMQEPEIQKLEDRITQLEELLAQTSETVSDENHPTIVAQRSELTRNINNRELAKQRLRPLVLQRMQMAIQANSEASIMQMRNQIDELTKQEEQLREELDKQEIETQQIGMSHFEMEALKQEIEQIESVSQRIAEETQKINIELTSQSRIALYRRAELPVEPDMKRKIMTTAMASFGVLALIVGGIIWLESAARRINSVREVTEGLSLPIMGSLPVMPRWMVAGRQSPRQNGRTAVWQSVWTESVDSARTMLLRESGGAESRNTRQIVMIASAMGGEGKTTLSCHLATSLARAGRKTLLVDCDLRRPNVNRTFDLPQDPGMCELLKGTHNIDDVIQEVPPTGLHVIPAGNLDQEVLQLLAKDGVETLFEKFRSEFDFIVVDSSPVFAGHRCDADRSACGRGHLLHSPRSQSL